MKKSLFIILILAVLLSFGACTGEETEVTIPTTVPVTEPPTEPPAPKAGLLLRNISADDQDAISLQSVLEDMGYEVLSRDAENDQAKQNEQATALIADGCEVLVLQPVMVSGLETLLEQLGSVPVIVLDAQPELDEIPDNVAILCPREEQAGTVQAALPAMLPGGGDLNGDGKVSVLMVQGPEDHMDANSRAAAFLAAVDPAVYTVLETVTGDWTVEGGKTCCRQMLSKYGPDIELIVTSGEEMALGAVEAIENGGWVPGKDMYLISVGSSTNIRTETRLGRVSGIATVDEKMRLQLLQELISGTLEEKTQYVDYIPLVSQ